MINDTYITIIETDDSYSLDELKIGEILNLTKEPDNRLDSEAILVTNKEGEHYGYIANSIDIVAKGTHSSGYVYNLINDNTKCKIDFIFGERAIGRLINGD